MIEKSDTIETYEKQALNEDMAITWLVEVHDFLAPGGSEASSLLPTCTKQLTRADPYVQIRTVYTMCIEHTKLPRRALNTMA